MNNWQHAVFDFYILEYQLVHSYSTAQLQSRTCVSSTCVLLTSFSRVSHESVRTPWLLTSIIVKYMDIMSRVLAWHTTGNLIVTDGSCVLGPRVKKGEDSTWTYMQIAS